MDPEPVSADDVLNAAFSRTQMRRGYDEREVDEFLDRVTATLRLYESGSRPPGAPDLNPPPLSAPASGLAPTPVTPSPTPTGVGRRLGRWIRGDPS